MGMRVGIVGVGRWGRTLAQKLIEAGAEIAAHDRAGDLVMPDRFGPRVPWRSMLDDDKIDAVVAATPPGVTGEIFLACQAARKPCLLTKPLIVDPGTEVTTTTYIDYVHLYSHLWNILWTLLANAEIRSMNAVSTGGSPPRSFPASLDYGPHAMAMLLTAAGDAITDIPVELSSSILTTLPDGHENLWAEMQVNDVRATLSCGNMGVRTTLFFAQLARKNVSSEVEIHDVIYAEADRKASLSVDGKIVARDDHHDPLSLMVQKFLWDAAVGAIDDYPVRLSEKISTVLTEARAKAK